MSLYPSETAGSTTVRTSLALALALAVSGGAAAASVDMNDTDNETLQRTTLTSLPRVEGRGWLLNMSLQTRYETNLLRNSPADPGTRLTPQATGGIGLPFGRQQLFVGGRFGRDIIYGVDRLPNRNRYAYGGGLGWQLGTRCDGVIGGEVSSSLSFFNENASNLDNALRISNYGAEATCHIGGRLSINGSASHREFVNSNPQRAAFNNKGETYTLGVSYAVGPFGTVSATGSIDDRRFTDRQTVTATGPEPDGLVNRSLQVGWSRDFGTRINLALSGSYINAKPQPASQLLLVDGVLTSVDRGTFSGIGYNGSLTLRPSTRLTLNLAGSRQVRATPNVGALYIVVDMASADIQYRLSQRLGLAMGASYLQNQFRGSFVTVGESRQRVSDKIKRLFATINYTPRERYGLSLEAMYFKRDSVPTFFSTDSFAVMMNLRVNLGRKR